MAEVKNSFSNTIDSLVKGMDGFVSSKTVIGEPVVIGGTTILPLVDVTFGMGAGTYGSDKKRRAGGGVGGKVSPTAVIVLQNGSARLVNIKNVDGVSKLLDMVPDFVNSFMSRKSAPKDPEEAAAYQEARAEAEEDLRGKLNLDEDQ